MSITSDTYVCGSSKLNAYSCLPEWIVLKPSSELSSSKTNKKKTKNLLWNVYTPRVANCKDGLRWVRPRALESYTSQVQLQLPQIKIPLISGFICKMGQHLILLRFLSKRAQTVKNKKLCLNTADATKASSLKSNLLLSPTT
jgi:hypothetical protein